MKRLSFDQAYVDKKAHQIVDKCIQFQNNEIDLKDMVNAIIGEIIRPSLGSEPDLWWWDDQRYNPYPLYWFDLLTERHLKNRMGECIDCFECCKYADGGQCQHVDSGTKRCKIYDHRTCDEWFPISQKELDYMKSVKPEFKCKLYW